MSHHVEDDPVALLSWKRQAWAWSAEGYRQGQQEQDQQSEDYLAMPDDLVAMLLLARGRFRRKVPSACSSPYPPPGTFTG